MIDWSSCTLSEPPILKHLTDETLEENIKTSAELEENTKFPCHTQGVERLIRLVSQASQKVYGEDARDGYVRATLNARKEVPRFDTKRQVMNAEE